MFAQLHKKSILKCSVWLLLLALPLSVNAAFTAIATGAEHSCVVTSGGGVKCWGGWNFEGQLGDGTTEYRATPVDVIGLGSGVIAIAAGRYHSCVVTSGGGVKCWGANGSGKLGDGTTVNRYTPVDVIGLGSGVIAIAAGDSLSCGLTSGGGVKCWGDNEWGQLGDGTTVDRYTPVDVIGLASGVIAIAAGGSHTCALTSDGGVKCWGGNAFGQLGDGTYGAAVYRATPVDVIGLGSDVIAIAAGDNHSCALTSGGGVKCWGYNLYGQLGDGSITGGSATPVDVIGLGSGVIAIAAGGSHSCALTDGGGAKCWGYNLHGQLGDGSTEYRGTPVGVVGLDSGVTAIAMNGDDGDISGHSCALTRAGGVKCWGANGSGVLGDGTRWNNKTIPVDVYFDTDTDLMPDGWEIRYGLNPESNDAGDDADHDGISNLQEYLNGSNPEAAKTNSDFNADGVAGWIWKGQGNGHETESQNWQLTFPLYSNNWAIPNRFYHPPFPGQLNWEIVTTGDFNKDGDADIVWRNNTSAQWKIWQMQDGTRMAQTTPADFDLAHEWDVIGAGDTDKDGDDDVILNNTTTGEVLIWEIQDHEIVNAHTVGTRAGYTLNRIGDFNKDGDVDLLFRQNSANVLVTWELEANAFVTERALANTGTNYNPVCAGDFDNDGDDDILFINSITQQEKWFVMENYARTQKFGSSNTGFVFMGCGDYDGDGDADSLWQRSADDANRVVLQKNFGAIKQTVYTNAFGGVNPSAAGYGFVYRGNGN